MNNALTDRKPIGKPVILVAKNGKDGKMKLSAKYGKNQSANSPNRIYSELTYISQVFPSSWYFCGSARPHLHNGRWLSSSHKMAN
jgi:hypothetical protein